MDLNTVETVLPLAEAGPWQPGDAALGGGTWLFSEPQPGLRRLIDLAGLGWDRLEADASGLRIGAMCTLGALAGFRPPPAWRAGGLLAQCCDALVASFKVQNEATVGGNLCLALPAGSMAALAVALEGTCTLRGADGRERRVPAAEFVTGPSQTVLSPGELLREIRLPAEALTRRTAFRRIALSPLGRSAALLIGTVGRISAAPSAMPARTADSAARIRPTDSDSAFSMTVTASVKRPVHLVFPSVPGADALQAALRRAIPDAVLHDDVHGDPAWRRHMTELLAEEIRLELGGPACG